MINRYCFRIIYSALLGFILSASTHAQLFWKINAESGYYSAQGSQLLEQDELLTRLDANLRYRYKYDHSVAAFDIKVRPEFYGFGNRLQIVKMRGRVSYLQNSKNFNWGINLTSHRYLVSGLDLDLSYENLILETHLLWQKESARFFQANLGYAYQQTQRFADLNLDIIFLQGGVYHLVSNYFKYGYGIYLENFYITYDVINFTQSSEMNNSGWRTGPLLVLNYIEHFMINFDYRFLIHHSKFTTYPSYEQWLRLLAGKIFLSRWSAFFIIDYYLREFKRKSDMIDEINALYTPINRQNRIFFKLAYDISDKVEAYFKYGYFKEDLYNQNYNIAGWNGLVGIEIRK
jgi:hypothetical protein